MKKNETELTTDLTRLIRGELNSADLKRLALRAGFQSFADLCESGLPEELARVNLTTRDVVTRIDRLRAGQIDMHELWFWADELYNISFNHRIAYEAEQEDLILTALSVMSVICNQQLFPVIRHTQRALEYLRACLVRRGTLKLRHIFSRAFEALPVAHLATKLGELEPDDDDGADGERSFDPPPSEPGALLDLPNLFDEDAPDADARDSWADVVMLDSRFDSSSDISSQYNWVIAFSVVTKELFDEELNQEAEAAGEGRGVKSPHPRPKRAARDRIPYLRKQAPNFAFDRYKPIYVCDGDGIAEIVLDTGTIGPDELRYATKLFAMQNRIGRAHLNGDRVPTLLLRSPGRPLGPSPRNKKARRRKRRRRS